MKKEKIPMLTEEQVRRHEPEQRGVRAVVGNDKWEIGGSHREAGVPACAG